MVLTPHEPESQRFITLLNRLGRMSVEDYYNPYRMFDWPDSLPTDELWMSRNLLSVYNTPYFDEFGEEQLIHLSIWESVNFYSLNVHGIRELLIEVVNRVHMPGFEIPSEFFHHFIGEENEHMWFFAEFCRRYGEKFYEFPRAKTMIPYDRDTENFLVFARILLFEEVVDHYNQWMSQDETLHETIRQINGIHHRDESRHIAFGRELVTMLYGRLQARLPDDQLAKVHDYLRDYLDYCLGCFYSLAAYRDAGIKDPMSFRTGLIALPGRKEIEREVVRKPVSFFSRIGIFEKALIS